jgi:hypothetical protein
MWPIPFLVEGILIGVLVSEVVRRKLVWRFVLGLVVLALIASILGCASRPEPEKASRWLGACRVCERAA